LSKSQLLNKISATEGRDQFLLNINLIEIIR